MNSTDVPSGGTPDDLAGEAAHWFARMRAPDAEASRPGFEAWLASSPTHRSAYNRAAEVFAMGKLLTAPDTVQPHGRNRRRATTALALCTLAVLAGGGWALLRPAAPPDASAEIAARAMTDRRKVSTVAGETRLIRLRDGSIIRLSSDTMLEIRFDAGRRALRLTQGQARFEVAHEARPFVVLAGGGSITARGTIFEVTLAVADRVDVRLVQGAIDVRLPSEAGVTPTPVRRLTAGESLSYANAADVPPAASRSGAALQNKQTGSAVARDFEGITVALLIDQANRVSSRPIRLVEKALGSRRVSGRFRIDDTTLLAERLAALFGTRADTSRREEVVLGR